MTTKQKQTLYDEYATTFKSPPLAKSVFAALDQNNIVNPYEVYKWDDDDADDAVRLIWCADDRKNFVFLDLFDKYVEVTRVVDSVILPEDVYYLNNLKACCVEVKRLTNALRVKYI